MYILSLSKVRKKLPNGVQGVKDHFEQNTCFFLHEDIPIPNSKEGFSIHDLEALSLTIFRWCATRRSPGAGSVEGGAVVGRRLTTLPTKVTHELAKKASLLV